MSVLRGEAVRRELPADAHHLATTQYIAHEVAVMYLGKIVERARTKELFKNPLHPYTKALFSAALPAHPDIVR